MTTARFAVATTEGLRSTPPSARAVRVVPRRQWDSLLSRLGTTDVYLSAGYHRASAALEPEGTLPLLLHYRDGGGEVALPLLLRPLDSGAGWDATSAYGYGGPVISGEPGIRAFGVAMDAWARDNRVVATFLRLHPLLGNSALVPPGAECLAAGSTVVWDVTAGRDLLAAMHPHHRRAIRKAERAGVIVTVDPRPAALSDFRDLYFATMRRQDATPFFFFGANYWRQLEDERNGLAPLRVDARLDGRLVASLLCFPSGMSLHYHLGASNQEGRTIDASHRCFLAAARWAQEQGMTRFHLGGGVGARTDSPLFTFKHRFDPAGTPLPFQVVKWVHDQNRFRRLTGGTSTTGFFPPWRRTT